MLLHPQTAEETAAMAEEIPAPRAGKSKTNVKQAKSPGGKVNQKLPERAVFWYFALNA